MISFLQQALQKHHKWLFSVLLAVIIIAFVFTIGGSPGIGNKQKSLSENLFYGVNLNAKDTLLQLQKDVHITSMLNTGQIIYDTGLLKQSLLTRIYLLYLADQFLVPEPSEKELSQYIQSLPIFLDSNGKFSESSYNQFLNLINNNPQLNQESVRQTLAQNYRIKQIMPLIYGPAYILDFDAKQYFTYRNTEWSIQLFYEDIGQFNPEIDFNTTQLMSFYESDPSRFKIPPQIVVTYATFSQNQFASNLDEPDYDTLYNFYENNTDLFSDNNTAKSDVYFFEKIQNKVKKAYIDDQAKKMAVQACQNIIQKIHDQNIRYDSPAFYKLLDEYSVQLNFLGPITKGDDLNSLILPAELIEETFKLDARERYYTDPYSAQDGRLYVVFLHSASPERIPGFNEAEDAVVKVFAENEKQKLFHQEGEKVYQELKSALESGQPLAKVALQHQLTTESFKNFSLSKFIPNLNPEILSVLPALEENELSKPIPLPSRNVFIHVVKKYIPDINPSSEELNKIKMDLSIKNSLQITQNLLFEMIAQGTLTKNNADSKINPEY